MARFKAYIGVDMSDTRQAVGTTTYAAEDVVVLESNGSETYYYGDFSFPGNQWKGEIKSVYQVTDGLTDWYVTRLHLDAKFAQLGHSTANRYANVFSEDDRISGSEFDDTLFGFDGADRISGLRGDDILQGRDGSDDLDGGRGRDDLKGGKGYDTIDGGGSDDVLAGGRAKDTLTGGSGSDTFVFKRGDGRDRITDFDPDVDHIQFDSGANKYSDLEISRHFGGVLVEGNDVSIYIEDIKLSHISSEDFLFI